MMHRLAVMITVLAVTATLLGSALVAGTPRPREFGSAEILFHAGEVVRITNFSALASFVVPNSGGQFVGAADVDHSVFLMVWSNVTPLPLCPDVDGYVGIPWHYAINESLAPGFYRFGPVCGGFANLTVTQDIEIFLGVTR